MSALPRQRFGVADVRDVADAHLKAMTMPDVAISATIASGRRADVDLAGPGRDDPGSPRRRRRKRHLQEAAGEDRRR